MKPSGISRRIDHLGRIVVPAEMRRSLGIREGDEVQFSLDGSRIVVEKVEDRCTFCGATQSLREHLGKQVCAMCMTELTGRPTG